MLCPRSQFALCGRLTPQRLRRERSVFGCKPSRRAAPRSPSITQCVSVSTCSTYQRSTSEMVLWDGTSGAFALSGGGAGDAVRSG